MERGLDTSRPLLVCTDGAKALRKAVRVVLGEETLAQRCVRHKERDVLDHLPEQERPGVRRKLRDAWADDDHARALASLRALALKLEKSNPSAAASLGEGLEGTLTVTRLGVTGTLKRTLHSTSPIESMVEIVRWTQRNVTRWRHGDMRQRWTAAGMLEAERQFRRVKGYRQLPSLVAALERAINPTEEVATVQAA